MLNSVALKMFLKEQKKVLCSWPVLTIIAILQLAFCLVNLLTPANWAIYQILLPVIFPVSYILAARVCFIWQAELLEKAEYYNTKIGE